MSRMTIDFGIDLGTTNSAIAVLKGTEVEVFKNNEGFEYTPSAVWVDKQNRLYVGRRAKERLEDDHENAYCEFKLQMGTNNQYTFSRSGRSMKPEELSAEVLNSLKAEVKHRAGEDVLASVITVPAAFELPQCEATKRAAQLAGFAISPLLQEPVAAALAYSFQSESEKVFWLVYDFGGGTFDAAIIQVRDGVIQVVNHGGDNHLGGKLIDWAIVEELLIPAVTSEHKLSDFRRGNAKWRAAIGKLKYHAELAKIRVSRDETAEIIIEFLCQDDRGEAVRFEHELKRADVERLMEPFIARSINICQKVLQGKRLGVGNIEKVLLVGGPTLTPYLRQRLADRDEGLGIPLEFRVDPLTVVAQGAAIFAGTQRLEGIESRPVAAGQFAIELEYKPVGADEEPLVGGKVVASNGADFSGYTIEFVNAEARPQWRSGKVALAANGAFMTSLWAEKGRPNTFLIELFDATGTKRETVPDRMSYTIGITITDPPLIHSVGVALANNEVRWFLEKGKPLPARHLSVLRTAYEARTGQDSDLIKIPVIEGDNPRADRNRLIGTLVIHPKMMKRNIPAGSEVEVIIEMDPSRLIRTKAFIPVLDEEFEEVLTLSKEDPDPDKLTVKVEAEKKRLGEARKKADEVGDLKAQQIIQRIENEKMEHEIDTSLSASRADRDAGDKCQNRLLDLQAAIDELEESLEWPALLAEAEDKIKYAKEIIQEYGSSTDKQNLATLERETRQAMDSRDAVVLRRKVNEINAFAIGVLREQPGFWVSIFHQLEEHRSTMKDSAQADKLFTQGSRAINNNDLPALKAAVSQLIALLPAEERQQIQGFGSTVI